jgi:hypothetical protein
MALEAAQPVTTIHKLATVFSAKVLGITLLALLVQRPVTVVVAQTALRQLLASSLLNIKGVV